MLVPVALVAVLAGAAGLAWLAPAAFGAAGALTGPALMRGGRVAIEGAAAAALLAVPLGLAGALAAWRAGSVARVAVAVLALLVLVSPAPVFVSLRFMHAPGDLADAVAFAAAVARGAAVSLLIIGAGLRCVPPGLRRAAQLAGARPLQAWRHAVLAPLFPYLAASVLAALAAALAEGPEAAVLSPHLDGARAWIAPAALLLIAGGLAALATVLRRSRQPA
jgi:ABC-type spermidine/putrescine transport system permease subunit II